MSNGIEINKEEWSAFFDTPMGKAFQEELGLIEQEFLYNLAGHTSFEDYKLYDGILEGIRRVIRKIDSLKKGE